MNLIKPKKIEKGATISIIAPSGCIDFEKVLNAKKYFENKGFKVKLGENIQKKYRYMAGTDEERLSDIHNAFFDKDVDAIICARGGYGAIRLLDKIDYDLIKNNPKIFCGYSDISALSAMIFKKTGLITFSGPMAKSDFQIDNICEFTEKEFWKTLASNHIKILPKDIQYFGNIKEADGLLIGGNLATIASMCGLDFIPDDKFVFFAEDLNEPVYKIDKYFSQLLNIGKFKQNLAGIILGDFLDIEDNEPLNQLFEEIATKLNILIIGNYPITHAKEKITVPYGGIAKIINGIIEVDY